ncbi:MAG: ATP-binding protein, partial [Planctomycetaceae bacterium]|nr:ATP-binding protein [Planctomycetaceae bacterium]
YMGKISGPLLDRIDIHIEVPATEYKELASKKPGTSSAEMREQVLLARKAQAERFNSKSRSLYNANLSSRQVREYCPLDRTCQSIMKTSVEVMGLSARAHDKILRVARTIADLDASDNIQPHHLNEAVNYRILDRNLWN